MSVAGAFLFAIGLIIFAVSFVRMLFDRSNRPFGCLSAAIVMMLAGRLLIDHP